MKTILVPTDFSDYSNNALDFAYNIAKKIDAEIQLVHVIESMDSQSYNTTGTIELNRKVDLYMHELMKVVTRQMHDIENDPKLARLFELAYTMGRDHKKRQIAKALSG